MIGVKLRRFEQRHFEGLQQLRSRQGFSAQRFSNREGCTTEVLILNSCLFGRCLGFVKASECLSFADPNVFTIASFNL